MSEEATGPTPEETAKVQALVVALRAELTKQQDPLYAVVGGLAAALVGAVLWALITVSTGYQIGYMAIGVGLLVGLAVRYFGAGIDVYFGAIGAFMALFGCALGNLLTQVGFVATAQSIGYFEVIALLNVDNIIQLYRETFSPMDILFYAIAGYEGYKFAFRKIEEELAAAVNAGKVEPPPFAKLRLPVVIVLFVGLSILGYVVSTGSTGTRTYTYESGAKRASGEMVHGRENGLWETWWENGSPQSVGYYTDGQPDSVWHYFNEDGAATRDGRYMGGVEHGVWTEFYPDGSVSGKGSYHHGRLEGPWVFNHENGKVMSKGSYLLDNPHGPWEYFYDNGKPSATGTYDEGTQTGRWTYWSDDEKKSRESDFSSKGVEKIMNLWNEKGKQEIVNGNGVMKYYFDDGAVQQTGSVTGGMRSGTWKKYFNDGSPDEEGEYRGDTYYVINSWTPSGDKLVVNGNGTAEIASEDGTQTRGLIENGLRTGTWTTYYPGGETIMNELTYVAGKLEGPYVAYFDFGGRNVVGAFSNDERAGDWRWYTTDGPLESMVSYAGGKKEGVQFFFTSDSTVIRSESYNKGKLIESKLSEL